MDRSPDRFWLGVAHALAFLQADLDTEANAKAGHGSALRVRLPWEEQPSPEDLREFGLAIDELNEECQILYWRLINTDKYGEHTIELASTEGFQGVPDHWDDEEVK